MAKLTEAFALEEMPLWIDRLQFQPMNGFMNGFIDLTFSMAAGFILPIGNRTGSLDDARLSPGDDRGRDAAEFLYPSTCIYSVALHRYLRLRKPSYDFDQHFRSVHLFCAGSTR
jgi:exodeoxyribonuclease V beta subunit